MANTDLIKTTLGEVATQQIPLKGLIGLGSGTTLEAYLYSLGKDLKQNPDQYTTCHFLCSSKKTEQVAKEIGLKVLDISPASKSLNHLDLYIDGLDQVDKEGRMIKGKGGALTKEKILCQYALNRVFLCDSAKVVSILTTILPVEIIPLSYPFVKNKLHTELRIESEIRKVGPNPYITDNGNWILDLSPSQEGSNWTLIAPLIASWAGVVETGFFHPTPFDLLVGYPNQKTEILKF